MIFKDRKHAACLLSDRLASVSAPNPIIFALPRGGVPIGYEIAKALNAPLEVLVVRKIGAPFNPEYGIGAITEGGYYWIDPVAASAIGSTKLDIERIVKLENAEVSRRIKKYRKDRPLPSLKDRTVIVIDDGLATGVTAKIACRYLKKQGAKKVILALPVCAPKSATTLRTEVDEVICLEEPEIFHAVSQFYKNFDPISDEEVISLLTQIH